MKKATIRLEPDAKNTKKLIQSGDPIFRVAIAVLVALLLSIYPLSLSLNSWRPEFVFVVCFASIAIRPDWCGVWFAFLVGLCTDLFGSSLVGAHALSFVSVSAILFLGTQGKSNVFSNAVLSVSFVVGLVVNFVILDVINYLQGSPIVLGIGSFIATVLVWLAFLPWYRRWIK